jgi:ParB-like chromosome segregation protein Spo0J
VEAAKQLGWDAVAVVWVKDTRRQQAGFALADNRTAELSEWDQQLLGELLAEVKTTDDELSRALFCEALAEQEGIKSPNFQPVGIDEQSRLDQKDPVKCPECGHEFTA